MAGKNYTFIAYLNSTDEEYVKQVLYLTDFQFRRDADNGSLCALNFGQSGFNHCLISDLESELVSVGLGVSSCHMWWS